jgi:predicted transcriptional regulator
MAAFIDELSTTGHLTVAEIAKELSRSKSWVSMRLGLISEMSATIRAKLLSGTFPVYSYMYALRPFMRMNGVSGEEVDQFALAVSDKGLSLK